MREVSQIPARSLLWNLTEWDYAGCKQMEEEQWWQQEARLCYIEAVRILSLGLVKEDEWINDWVEGGKEMCWLHEKYEEGIYRTFN